MSCLETESMNKMYAVVAAGRFAQVYGRSVVPRTADVKQIMDEVSKYLNDICEDAVAILIYKLFSVDTVRGIDARLDFAVAVDVDRADVYISLPLLWKLHDEIANASDGFDVFTKFVEFATAIKRPYTSRGMRAYINDTGGDYFEITVAACYHG